MNNTTQSRKCEERGSKALPMSTKVYNHTTDQRPNIQTVVFSDISRETFLKLCSAIWGDEFQRKVEDLLSEFTQCSMEVWDGQMQEIYTGACIHAGRDPWHYRSIYEFESKLILNTPELRQEVRARVEENNRRIRAEIATKYGC